MEKLPPSEENTNSFPINPEESTSQLKKTAENIDSDLGKILLDLEQKRVKQFGTFDQAQKTALREIEDSFDVFEQCYKEFLANPKDRKKIIDVKISENTNRISSLQEEVSQLNIELNDSLL